MYFLVPETAYNPKVDPANQSDKMGNTESLKELPLRKLPYRQLLTVYNGRFSQDTFWMLVIKPIRLIVYPAVLFSTVVYGSFGTWLISISLLSSSIFAKPPYSLTPAAIGLTHLPLLAVSLISTPISGWLVDKCAKSMARRNNGVFEPEFRLVPMALAVLFTSVGFLGFGITTQAGGSVYLAVTFLAIHGASVPFATQTAFTYTMDCHPKDANQAFVTITFMKSLMTFLASTFVDGWLAAVGPRSLFVTLFVINFILGSLTIPVYIFGKRMRSAVSQIPN